MRKEMTTDTNNNESKQQGSRTKEAKREKKITDLQGCRKHKKNQYHRTISKGGMQIQHKTRRMKNKKWNNDEDDN